MTNSNYMRIAFWTVFSVVFAFILSCQNNKEPNYPIIPYVEFRELKYILGINNSSVYEPDTVRLKFYLRDGDFDLGLDRFNTQAPYNPITVLNKLTGQFIPLAYGITADHSNLILYSDKKTIDTLPPLSCSRWTQTYTLTGEPSDTVYCLFNSNYSNLFIDIFMETSPRVWSYFDYTKPSSFPLCQPPYFNGRFPTLPFTNSNPFKYQQISLKEGVMTYDLLIDYGVPSFLSGKKIKFQFSIQDRALHRSNIAETTEIQF